MMIGATSVEVRQIHVQQDQVGLGGRRGVHTLARRVGLFGAQVLFQLDLLHQGGAQILVVVDHQYGLGLGHVAFLQAELRPT
jgi:hypothetical protein